MSFGSDAKRISILFSVFAFVYFPMLASLPLSIDAEVTIRSHTYLYWITQGRWAAYIVTILFPPHLAPYFTLAIFGIAAAYAYQLLLRTCNLPLDLRATAAFPIFVGFPIWSFILEFSANVVQVGLGLLCCCGALRLLIARVATKEGRPYHVIAESILVGCAIALYQSFTFVFPTLVLSWIIITAPPMRAAVRALLQTLMVWVAAVGLYYFLGKLFAAAFDVSPGYVGQFVRLSVLVGDVRDVVLRSLLFLFQIYAGAGEIYGPALYSTAMLTVIFGLVIAWQRPWRDGLFAIFLLLIPLSFVVIAGGQYFPPRALLGVPVALWTMAIVAMYAEQRSIAVLGVVATLLVGFQSASAISGYQTVRLLRSEFDRSTATRLYARISEVADMVGPYKVEFFGGLKAPDPIYPVGLYSSAGGSFFSWDGGNPNRIVSFMWLLGYQDLVAVEPGDRNALIPEFAQMPSWPRRGSVRMLGDLILVKLSDSPGRYCPSEDIGKLAAC
ncbi:hypothetical protein PMI09_00558 [Rhizobium sp. CF122]|uniref:glucosyltransferase domain-containing protein n=1 Tax=Rhizobium sp. CF122 TaxID=1144312 RepID=UPI00027185FE|nr:glucosyltransferase domain-containing protein [Rhizobium sp. CF122]EJL58065.1 hypothetical protein PMI09_00558 [Rhizobium sp. CF122]